MYKDTFQKTKFLTKIKKKNHLEILEFFFSSNFEPINLL